MLRVTVSFKQTTRDIRLYTIVNGKEEKSDFVKDAIEYYMIYLETRGNKDVCIR